jgi:hypothetical protein
MDWKLVNIVEQAAKNARKLIPRSVNRGGTGSTVGLGSWGKEEKASDPMTFLRNSSSYWLSKEQMARNPLYYNLLFSAMMADSTCAMEKCIIMDLNIDVNMYYDPKERMLNEIYIELLNNLYGWDETHIYQVMAKLGAANVANKMRKDKDGNIIKRHKAKGNPTVFEYIFKVKRKGERYTTIDSIYDFAKNAIRFEVGNCDQCSAMAFIILAELGSSKNSEVKAYLKSTPSSKRPYVERIVGDGHCMVMIGRKEAPNGYLSSINNINTYQTDGMIVCDPWFFNKGGIIVCDKNTIKVIENGKLATTKDVVADGKNLWRHIVNATKKYNPSSTAPWQSQALNQTHCEKIGAGLKSSFRRNPKYKNVNFFDDPDGTKKTLISVYREKHKQIFAQLKKTKKRKELHETHRKQKLSDSKYGKGEALSNVQLKELWKKIESGETFDDKGNDTIILKEDNAKITGDIVQETPQIFKIKTQNETRTVRRVHIKKVIRTGGEMFDKRRLLLLMDEATQKGKDRRIRLMSTKVVLKTARQIIGYIVAVDTDEIKIETRDSDKIETVKRKDIKEPKRLAKI